MEMWKLITVNTEHKQDYRYSISLKIHIVVDIRGICRRTYLSTQNNNIFYAKRNSARKVAFDMPTNVGPKYGMYVSQTSYQRHTSNIFYVGATLCQHVGPTMAQRANLLWTNVVCQCWANGVANQNTPLAQRYHAIWEALSEWKLVDQSKYQPNFEYTCQTPMKTTSNLCFFFFVVFFFFFFFLFVCLFSVLYGIFITKLTWQQDLLTSTSAEFWDILSTVKFLPGHRLFICRCTGCTCNNVNKQFCRLKTA